MTIFHYFITNKNNYGDTDPCKITTRKVRLHLRNWDQFNFVQIIFLCKVRP
jgi:hypothetical protein